MPLIHSTSVPDEVLNMLFDGHSLISYVPNRKA